MFDLEKAIQAWKRNLRHNPAFEDGDIAELESHLRDEIEELKTEGLSEELAFQQASSGIGEPESLGDELYKTKTSKADTAPPWKQKSWIPSLLPNYLKIALRTFKRHPGTTFINIFGLAVGLACCLLIGLFVKLEASYDRFHTKSDRMYRVVTDINQKGQTRKLAWSSPPLGPALVKHFPEVEQAVRIHRAGGTLRKDEESEVVQISFVDSTFFDVFDFKLKRGNPQTALSKPGNIVLSQEQADRLFKGKDPMYKNLVFADTLHLQVTGVLGDIPPNSHFRPSLLANLQVLPQQRFQRWGAMNLWTYIVLKKHTSGKELESKLPDFVESKLGKDWSKLMVLHLQPLTSIYFKSDRLPEIGPTGDPSYMYIFSGIGLFVLLIAGINFMNLTTAQSFQRAREIGVRKVLGVSRAQLIRQFLGEAVLLAVLAMLLAFVMALTALPVFAELSGYELQPHMLFQPALIAGLVAATFFTGILSGSYPAFVLSAFNPSAVLSGLAGIGQSAKISRPSGSVFRRGLVVLQFSITVILVAGTGVIASQMHFIQKKNLGFDKEHILVIRLSDRLRNSYGTFKQNLLRSTDIVQAGASSQVPGLPVAPRGYRPEGMADGDLLTNTIFVDEDFLQTIKIKLAAGRAFSPERPADLSQGFILNEAAVHHFGWIGPKQALGKSILAPGRREVKGKVIGVVKDFNYESLHSTVKPLVIRYREQENLLSVRLAANHIKDGRNYIEQRWKAAVPGEPLVSWFLDDQLQNLYEAEQHMGSLFRYFSAIAIILACLGLFGLASFSIQKRTKEIGIRKVLGASISRIMALLSREYIGLVILANLIAWPVAYLVMSRWLHNFAFRVPVHTWIFVAAGGSVLIIALATVSYHTLKAALMNPVNSLRSE